MNYKVHVVQKEGLDFKELVSGFITLSFFLLKAQGFVLSAKTSEAAKFSEDTSSLSQCQQEQEARCVLYAVIHLIYASASQMNRDSCQLPGFHLVSIMLSCVMMCSINDTTVFGNSSV